MQQTGFTYQLRTAVTWHIICELLRRHKESCDLWVLETHPGGGQYDCLSLFHRWPGAHSNHLCDFNQQSQHLHVWGHYRTPRAELSELRWPDGNDYVLAYLAAPERTLAQIEDLVGLPRYAAKHHPPTTPPILIFRIISAVLDRYALSMDVMLAFMGYEDTSGFGGGLREALRWYPTVWADVSASADAEDGGARKAAKYWLLSRPQDVSAPPVLLDMRGKVYAIAKPDKPWDCWHEYQVNGRKLLPIVHRVETMLAGGKIAV